MFKIQSLFSYLFFSLYLLLQSSVCAQSLVDYLAVNNTFSTSIHAKATVKLFYKKHDYQLVWGNHAQVERVIKEIENSDNEGLFKEDYHYQALIDLRQIINSSTDEAFKQQAKIKLDILLTDAVMLYAFHLINGKVDPNSIETSWNYASVEILPNQVIDTLTDALTQGTIVDGLNAFKPEFEQYVNLKKALAHYRSLAADNTFVRIPNHQTLRAGVNHTSIVLLRQRLKLEGFDAGISDNPELFDQALKAQVQAYQTLHGMEADGIAGKNTIRELNIPFTQRTNQIRANLERTRWIHDDVKSDFVLVNLAGYTLYLVRDEKLIWQTDVMIGKQEFATEIFREKMKYIVFNPSWTVPRSIMRRSLINKILADPNYLTDNDFVLLDRKSQPVDLNSVDWSSLHLNYFPYIVRQLPGKKNALGQVKFIFPNEHAIYLHDTPAKALFEKTQRAFSSGCVRVKEPFEFARLLLNDGQWDNQAIQTVLSSKALTRINLPKEIDVMLMYWTVVASHTGKLHFYPDVYQRDEKLIKQLTVRL